MIFKKKSLSQELKLEKILYDIKNIAYANPNAALSQLRTFVEVYTNAVLIYENRESDLDLVNKINTIRDFDLLSVDEVELMHQIRKTGNNAVHSYYYSKEEVLTYLEVCISIYEKFVQKYENDRINYKKKLIKSYLATKDDNQKLDLVTTNISNKPTIDNSYKGNLISEDSVIVADEKYDIDSLDKYDYLKNRVIKNIVDVKSISDDLGIKEENLELSKDKLEENRFNLVVLGEFNRGKSTFLNALLGRIILPSNILPTTSVITRISYDEKESVKVTLNDGTVNNVDPKDLINYVTTLDGNDSKKVSITDVYYPLKFCKNGCTITDTPGVNDLNEQNIAITENYIPEADAVIFMLDPDQVFTESEKYFIRNKVLKNDINKIFFIVNKFDSINKDGVENFKNYVYRTLKELDLDSKVYFLSSKKSLICKITGKVDEYLELFNEFSDDLEKFLIEEKGKYILLNGCNRLKSSIHNVISNIYEVEADMLKSIDKLEKDYHEFNKISSEVKRNKLEIIGKIDKEYLDFRTDVKRIIYKELSTSFDNLIDDIYNQDNIDEIVLKDLENNINTYINKWINSRVNPFVLGRINRINSSLMELLKDSLKYISQSNNYDLQKKSTELVVVESSKFELPTSYNTIPVSNNQSTFIGAGAILTILLKGTLLSGIGGAFLGLIAHEIFRENKKSTKIPKEDSIRNIEAQKTKAINSIIKSIEKNIDNSYKQNCKYIDESINAVLDTTSKRMRVILDEKKKQNNDLDFLVDNLNTYLNQLFIIKKHNELIIKSLEG